MNTRSLNIKDYWIEFVVGMFFFLMLLILGYYTIILSKDGLSRDSYLVCAKFPEVSNLVTGNKVLLRGMEVGSVRRLLMDSDGVTVEMAIKKNIEIFNGCEVKIESASMLGGNLVSINQGKKDLGLINKDQILKGSASKGLMSEVSDILADLKASGVFDDIKKTAKNVDEITSKINNGEGTLGKLINDDSFYEEAKSLISELKKAGHSVDVAGNAVEQAGKDISSASNELKSMLSNVRGDIDEAIKNITDFTRKLSNEDSTVARLFTDKGVLFEDIQKGLSELRLASEKLNSNDGTLGKLLNDPQIYNDVRETLNDVKSAFVELKGAMQDMRETSTISTFGSFIFGAL